MVLILVRLSSLNSSRRMDWVISRSRVAEYDLVVAVEFDAR